jgi:hypothetical protein
MPRLLAAVISLAVFIGLAQLWPATAKADDAQNVANFRQLFDAFNRGNVAASLGFYTDDAQISGLPPLCAPSCTGKATIQRQFELNVADHTQLQLLSTVQVVNGNLIADVAIREDLIRAAGLSRIVTHNTFTFRGDKISKLVSDPVASDPQTAAFLRASSQPIPVVPVAPPVPVVPPEVTITAPSTGDGGLLPAAISANDAQVWVLAIVVLVTGCASLGVAFQRRRGLAGL